MPEIIVIKLLVHHDTEVEKVHPLLSTLLHIFVQNVGKTCKSCKIKHHDAVNL